MPGKQVKKEDITFSDIYNVINNPATHDGTSPISFNSFRSSIVDAEARKASLPANQDYKFNYSEGSNKTISNYNNLIVTNVGAPNTSNNARPNLMNFWPTASDMDGNDNISGDPGNDPTHAWIPIPDMDISGAGYDWMSGNFGGENQWTFSFMMIHNSTKATLNIDWKRSSAGTGGLTDNFYVYKYETNSGDNYKSVGSYSTPTGFTQSGDNIAQNESGSQTLETTAEYITLFYFKNNSSGNQQADDRTYIRIRGAETGLVPYNFIEPPILLSSDISLNSTTENKIYAPTTTIKFGNYSPNNQHLPEMNNSDADGEITFDAGPGNNWKIELGEFEFWRAGSTNLFGQLALRSKENLSDSFSKVTIPGLINTYGQRASGDPINWTANGYVIPGNNTLGISWGLGFTNPPNPTIISNKRYLKFTYINNIETDANTSGPNIGWTFTLQRLKGNVDYNGIFYDSPININSDFRTRIKNHNPILKITEADGIDSSGNTTTNKDTETINLHLDVSGSRPTTQNPSRISTDKLYDLSLNDITASNNTLDISSAFSGMIGESSFILASIGKVGYTQQTITVDVSANTYRNEYGNWNDVSGSDYGKFTWNFSDTTGPTMIITAAEGTTPFTSNDGTLSLTFTSSESTTDFSVGDITLTNGNLGTLTPVSSTVYTATFTPTVSNGTCTINVAGNTFKDLALNDNTASDIFNWTRDTVRPTMVISAAEGATGFTSNDNFITLTFTSTKVTTDFVEGDITLSNGSLIAFAGSGTTYTANFTPDGASQTSPVNCTIIVAENAFTDSAGNGNDITVPTVFEWTSDRAPPTMVISSDDVNYGSTTANQSVVIKFTSNEAITDFLIGDITVSNGNLTNLQQVGATTVYTATFTATTSGNCTVDVNGSFEDTFGNINTTTPPYFSWTFSTTIPKTLYMSWSGGRYMSEKYADITLTHAVRYIAGGIAETPYPTDQVWVYDNDQNNPSLDNSPLPGASGNNGHWNNGQILNPQFGMPDFWVNAPGYSNNDFPQNFPITLEGTATQSVYFNTWDRYDDSWDGTIWQFTDKPTSDPTHQVIFKSRSPDGGDQTSGSSWDGNPGRLEASYKLNWWNPPPLDSGSSHAANGTVLNDTNPQNPPFASP